MYCALLTAVEITLLSVAIYIPRDFSDLFEAAFACNLSQAAVVFGTLLIFRAIGYRLVRVKRGAKALES
jgi:hypothetical protein